MPAACTTTTSTIGRSTFRCCGSGAGSRRTRRSRSSSSPSAARDIASIPRWKCSTESESVRRVAGDAEAMNRLGVLYAEGRGVSRDYSAALGWYRRAAAYGSSSALSNLATMYFYGFGVPQSYPKAAQLLQIAVRGGAPDAQNKLGALYNDGLGVVK